MPYYDDWGWIKPDGKILDGTKAPKVKDHLEFAKQLGFKRYKSAYSSGMIRWLIAKGRDGSFELWLALSKQAQNIYGKVTKLLRELPMPINRVSIDWFDLSDSDETAADTFDAPVAQFKSLLTKLPKT